VPHPGWADFTFDGIGTRWQISTPSLLSDGHRRRLLDVVAGYDSAWSRFRPDSLVSRAARQPGTYEFPAGAADLGRLYRALYRLTGGAMTPLVGGSLAQLGYDGGYSLRPLGPPLAAPRWEDALEWTGTELTTRAPVVVDVGAAGKGQLADLLSAELSAHGIGEHFIDASGDLLNSGTVPVEVALEHPYDTSRAIGTLALGTGALCASAANRRAWGDGLHHVLDGRTGRPTRDILATWVVADSCLLADGLATAHFLTDPALLMSRFDHEFVRMHADGRVERSPKFPGEVFS
jgi:thiamine biosynthesis lipoprotein